VIDLSPGELELSVLDGFARVLRDAETQGWRREGGGCRLDDGLWRRLLDLTPVMPEVEGQGLSFLTLALIADRLGAELKGLLLIDHLAGVRALTGAAESGDASAPAALRQIEAQGGVVGLAPRAGALDPRTPPLSLSGAIADWIIVFDAAGARFAAQSPSRRGEVVGNLADLPVQVLEPAEGWAELQGGPAAARMLAAEHRTLVAAAIGGMARRAMELATAYAKERFQFGQAIGSFQAIAHGLADAKLHADGIELLSQEAAWARNAAPERFELLSQMAFAHAAHAGAAAVKFAMHVFGGYGAMPDFPVQAYFRTVRAVSLAVGDCREARRAVGRVVIQAPPETPFALSASPALEVAGG